MVFPVYVAIPVYNGALTIRKTLDNILQQTYKDFHIIIYDDGSTDWTPRILEKFCAQNDRVTLLSGRENLGRGAARNRLLAAAGDGLIAWQDADDTWNPHKLEEQLEFFEKFSALDIEKNTSIMISTINRKSERKSHQHVVKCTPPIQYDAAFVLSDDYNTCPFQLQATFGLASVYRDAGGFDETLNWSEDFDMVLRLLAGGYRIVSHASERALATYHHSLSGADGDLVERAQQALKDRHRDFARRQGVDIDKLFARRRLTYLVGIYLKNRNFAKALATTLSTIVPGDEQEINLASRNIVAVMRAMLDDEDDSAE